MALLVDDIYQALIDEDDGKLAILLKCNRSKTKHLIGAVNRLTGKSLKEIPEGFRGFNPKWNHRPTRTVRVPVVFAQQVVDYAHQLDEQ